MAQPRRYSEATAATADKAVRTLLTDAEARARDVLAAHRGQLDRLIAALEDKETLDREAVAACLGPKAVSIERSGGTA